MSNSLGEVAQSIIEAVNHSLQQMEGRMDLRFQKLETRMDQVQGDVNTLKGDVNILKGDVNILKGDVNILKGDVNILKGDVKALETNLAEKTESLSDKILAVGVLVEEQNSQNRIVLEVLSGTNARLTAVEQRLDQRSKH